MNQKIKTKLEQAAKEKYPADNYDSKVRRHHFKRGIQHAIDHPSDFGLVDAMKADTVLHIGMQQIEGELAEAINIIESLMSYGRIHTVQSVVYPGGSHSKMIDRAHDWLVKNRDGK